MSNHLIVTEGTDNGKDRYVYRFPTEDSHRRTPTSRPSTVSVVGERGSVVGQVNEERRI